MIRRGYRYRLYPTPEQEELFRQFAGVCRLVYNLALEQRRDWFRQFKNNTGRSINYATQSCELTALRAEFEWVREVSSTCQQQALRDLDVAYQRWFRGVTGYPTLRKKGRGDSFRFHGREVQVCRLNRKWSEVKLPKIGWVRFRDTRPLQGKVKNITVNCSASCWFVSFSLAIEHEPVTKNALAVGLDRGVANTIAMSTGDCVSVPGSLADLEKAQRRVQKVLARRKRGSKRYRKAQRRIAALSARRARIRKDWHHRTSTELSRRFGTVVIENLNTKGMTASGPRKRGLNRAILNQGWYIFEDLLAYKLEERGGQLIKVDPAYTSQTCSACGAIDKESRKSQASFVCQQCGHRAHADTNAAINILRRSTASMDVEEGHWLSVEALTIPNLVTFPRGDADSLKQPVHP